MIAVMMHDGWTICATGRPLRMTYRPWQMTDRCISDLEAHDMSNQYKYVGVIHMCFDVELHEKT